MRGSRRFFVTTVLKIPVGCSSSICGKFKGKGVKIALITAASCKKIACKIISGLALELSKLDSAICGDGWISN